MDFASSAPPFEVFATIKTVSSPAIVPIALFKTPLSALRSIALANNCAPPGG